MKHLILVILSLSLNLFANDYQFAGKHFLASYLDCDAEAISDVNGLLQAMDEAVRASGATILNTTSHVFAPNGLTIVYLLSESHASIHTYPECGACFVDLFTCGDHCMAGQFDVALREFLKPKKVNARLFFRDESIHEIHLEHAERVDDDGKIDHFLE